MEQHDHLDQKFQSAFQDFEAEPPASVWTNVNRELHPAGQHDKIWSPAGSMTFFTGSRVRLWGAIAAMAVILFFATVYFLSLDRHIVKGHAYTGDRRLISGTAILFTVRDKSRPWDSVDYYRRVPVDGNGYFYFSGVDEGSYLLRVDPGSQPENADQFVASWYDMHGDPSLSHLIVVSDDDVRTDVHLIKKDSIPGP